MNKRDSAKHLFTSDRLQYREVEVSDSRNFFALDNDPDVMRWINGGEPLVFETFCRDQMPVYLQRYPEQSFGFFVIENEAGFVGWVSLRAASQIGEASLGYRLLKKAWGKGFASEAARAIVERGFREESRQFLQRIVANTYEKNLASQRVLTKVGMTLIRREQPTIAEFASTDTAVSDGEIWEGDEFHYAIERVTAT